MLGRGDCDDSFPPIRALMRQSLGADIVVSLLL